LGRLLLAAAFAVGTPGLAVQAEQRAVETAATIADHEASPERFTVPRAAHERPADPEESAQRQEGGVVNARAHQAAPSASAPESAAVDPALDSTTLTLPEPLCRWVDTDRLASSAQLGVTMLLLGLIPALCLMTTAYIRIAIVLSVLRQAFGTQLLPLQATSALTLLCTGLVMWPTWQSVHEKAIVPWMRGADPVELAGLWEEGVKPVREFMIRQIDARGSAEDVHLFLRQVATEDTYPSSYEEVPLRALLPAFVISELKAAFLIGFQIYLPFLVIDLVVATITTSMGMFMLPPGMVSLPLKLLLFVLVDGWRLIVEMLLTSFP
jgi:flagellar biosynthetic protein FliP